MVKRLLASLLFLVPFSKISFSQKPAQDTIFLMTGHVIGEKIIDTTLGAVTIYNPKKPTQKLHYEWDQLYMVKFSDGKKRFYYTQDSELNVFSRDEMWMYMKGENDARKGFKARGALIASGLIGLAAGMTGTFFAPVAPYGFMALSGITRVRIRHNTISNMKYIESDAYILGYERVARQKRKIKSIVGGTIGLALGYGFYTLFNNQYPEKINFGFNK